LAARSWLDAVTGAAVGVCYSALFDFCN